MPKPNLYSLAMSIVGVFLAFSNAVAASLTATLSVPLGKARFANNHFAHGTTRSDYPCPLH